MKRIFYCFCILLILLTIRGFSHSQRTHQYLVREGYKLLKLYLGGVDVPVLGNNIGTIHTGFWLNHWPDFGAPWGEVVK